MTPTESKAKALRPHAPSERQVQQVRFHIGLTIAQQAYSSIDITKDKATLEILPMGVEVSLRGETSIVPYGNIVHIKLVSKK